MKYNAIINQMIESKLVGLHTAFVGKILSTDGQTAKVQPLNMIKLYGGAAQKPTPITIPILKNARYKLSTRKITYMKNTTESETTTITVSTPLEVGDVVFCMCADRDITEAKQGIMSNAPCDRHSMSNAVVVGVFEG